jgi:hypothetical protein
MRKGEGNPIYEFSVAIQKIPQTKLNSLKGPQFNTSNFQGSGAQVQDNWVQCLGSDKAEIKVLFIL